MVRRSGVRHSQSMSTKRIAATILWFVTGWMLGAMAAFALDLPAVLAPTLGILSGILIFTDPARLMWSRRPTLVPEAPAEVESRAA